MTGETGSGWEARRLAALDRYEILDTPREESFDEIAKLAADICGTPMGAVSLIGKDRLFLKAEVGLGLRELPLENAAFARTILEEDFLLVPDASRDPRFRDHALVAGERGLRFYAGARLRTQDGYPMGALSVFDQKPRQELSELQQRALRVLARQVMDQLDLRKTLRQRSEDYARYRTLFESMDEGFCIIEFLDGPHGANSDFIHVEANSAYTRNSGISDVVGRKVRDMVPDEADGWVARFGPVLETGQPIRFEQELIATDRFLSLSAFRIEPASRQQVAVLFQDITPRRQAELALRQINETLEQRVDAALAERKVLADIVERTNAIIQIVDTECRWIAVNDASVREYERLFGFRPVMGESMLDVLSRQPVDMEGVKELWIRALAGEEFVETREFGNLEGERHYYEMRFNALRNAEGELIGTYQFVYDVTDRLREQQRLAEAEEALRQAQKMEAVGQLTGGLAHDFNNLLAGISGAFEMIGIRLSQGRSKEVDKYLVAGQGATRRAAALTHRLLAFSRRQTLSPKPIDINRLMAELVELIRRTAGPAIEVESVAAGGLWRTMVDANQLENAILNLCINARDAMPGGGKITIETSKKWLDHRGAQELGIEAGQYVTLCVSDTGTGIEKDVLSRVFDPFFTTKPIGEGTGLGLSMVYGFARQSNGHVRIYSEVGQGTMVCIYLPRHVGAVEEELAQLPGSIEAAGSGERILIVDDEPTVLMLLADTLSELGYECIEAIDGPSGLRLLEAGGRFDLLITDVGLPGGLNGRQVADAARQIIPDLKVLFITGYAENAVLNHGHIPHGMEVVTKPFAIDDIAARVDLLLHR